MLQLKFVYKISFFLYQIKTKIIGIKAPPVFIPTIQLLYLKRAILEISYPKIIIGKVKMNDIKTIKVDSIPEKPRYLKALVKIRYTK